MKLNKLRLSAIAAVAALVAAFILISSVMAQTASNPAKPYTVGANSMDLYPEWNLISVTPPMVGKSLFDMHNVSATNEFGEPIGKYKFPYACGINSAWIFDATTQKYEFVNPNMNTRPSVLAAVNQFSSNDVGLGLWVYVTQQEGCRFGCGITGCLPESS